MEIYFELFCFFMISFLKVSNGCNDGWFEYERYCYFFQNKLLKESSWNDAFLSCQEMNADLLSIEDVAENVFIIKSLENDSMNKRNYWIGLSDEINNRKFKWSDNKYSNFSNWLPKKPNNFGSGENCVETNSIGWNDNDCHSANGFICKLAKENGGSCPHGWISNKNYCYLFQNENKSLEKYNWFESYSSCLLEKGNLLSLEDQKENLFVKSILQNDSMKDQYFWIGLNYRISDKKFVWSDNTKWNLKKSIENSLTTPKGSISVQEVRCVVINAHGWITQSCDENYGYICKVEKESNNSCASDWLEFASYCYYFQSTNDGNSITWDQSYLNCLKKGGNLLSINDEMENEFILKILNSHSMDNNYWIGLTDLWFNKWFSWSDNTYSQYTYPKFYGLSNNELKLEDLESCVTINKSSWKIEKCESFSNGYICKSRRAKNHNCAEGWTAYRNHCYFLEPLSKLLQYNWYISFSSCQIKGGNLLSINNQEENRFIQNSLIKDNGVYWIGLNKLWNNRNFVWSDNTYTQFFNWSSSEEFHVDKVKSCVEMNSNGWSRKECNTQNGFICKKLKVRKVLPSTSYPANILPSTSYPANIINSTSYPANNLVSIISIAVLVPVLTVAVIFVIVVLRFQKKRSKKLMNRTPYTMAQYYRCDESLVDEWEIFPEDIIMDKKVGEGAFGTVFIAKLSSSVLSKKQNIKQKSDFYDILENTSNVAVKLLKNSADPSELTDFYEEMNLMKEIGYHKNIVNLIGCSTIKKPLCLIVEYMVHGDLLNFLRTRRTKFCASNIDGKSSSNFMHTPGYQQHLKTTTITTVNLSLGVMPNNISLKDDGTLTPDDLLSFAWQVASGMEFLTCSKLVHRDLAARNILVGAGKIIKISDFGLSRKINDELTYMSKKRRRLPVKWMSVEAIFDHLFTSFSDVWAYGVVLFEIVTLGGTPYPSISNRELLSLLKSGYRMGKPDNCSETMYEIMLQCWNEDPLQRPSFTNLRDYFNKVRFQGDCFLNFEFDENTASSFLPYETDIDDDNTIEDGFFQHPAHVKSIDEIKKLDESVFLLCDR